MLWLFILPTASKAEPGNVLDDEEPFAGRISVTDEVLEDARGRAVLPDGLTVEVSVLMRLLVDGHELERSMVHSAGAAVPVHLPNFPFADSPPPLENSLSGVALDHFQEINFKISNLPISVDPGRFMPPPVVAGDVIH